MIESPRTRIAPGLEVSFTFDPEAPGLRAQWYPTTPPRLDGQSLRRYRAARDLFMRVVAAHVGGSVIVVDSASDQLTATVVTPPKEGHA